MIAMVDCGDIAECVPPYLEEALSVEACAAVHAHLSGCASCREGVERFRRVHLMARNMFKEDRLSTDFNRKTGERMRVISSGPFPETEEEEEQVPAAQASWLDSLQQNFGAAPWWVISGSFHALVILLISLIGYAVLMSNEPDTVIVTNLEKQKEPPKVEEVKERTIIPQPTPVPESEIVTDQPSIVTHEEVEIADHVETADNSDAGETRGQDGISDVWLGGSGTVAAIGLGGGGGGAFGRPNGKGGRLRRAIRGGGGKGTESAVDKALEWLARHQSADGSWSTRATEGSQDWDPGVTGLAVLAFLGAGHTEKVGKYKGNVTRGVQWLISQQSADGAIGSDPKYKDHTWYGYHTAIAGMALAEAFGMAKVAATGAAAQKTVTYACEQHQQGDGSEKLGYRYQPQSAGDTSCSGWFVMMLKSAKVSGLAVNPASFEGIMKFFATCEAAAGEVQKGGDSSYDNGRYRFKYQPGHAVSYNNTAIGILAHLFTGTKPDQVAGAAAWLLATHSPTWSADYGKGVLGIPFPMYFTYYATLDMFQIGGDLWQRWNTALKAMLLPNQRRDGDFDGSWDPLSQHEKMAGRAYTTALGALSLEIYYRYLPMYRE